jgi:D-glycero-beta-D-manno-heptose 1-phosphate adenylyltransferase
MILLTEELRLYTNKLALVDGSFDPIHDGHVKYFQAASQLGMPVLCNVAPDSWTSSKHKVLLNQEQRGVVLDSIKYLDFVHLSSISTAEVIQLLEPRFYLKGNDWLTRGGVPEIEETLCRNLGIEILYLQTVTNSSSKLLQNWTVDLES